MTDKVNDRADDGPSPVGPLGAAMADLVNDVPPAGFTAWSMRGEIRRQRAVRRQVAAGLAAGVAAIGVVVLIGFTALGGGASGSATSATSATSGAATASSAAAAGTGPSSAPAIAAVPTSSSSSSAASSSSYSAATSGASTTSSAVDSGTGRLPTPSLPGPQNGADAGGGGPATVPETGNSCAAPTFTDQQLRLIADLLPGLTAQATCVTDDTAPAAQDYAVDAAAGTTLRAELRSGEYDPCAATGATNCLDVPGHPGVRTSTQVENAALRRQVWTSGRDGSVVLTLTAPAGSDPGVTVAQLTDAVEGLASSR